MKGQLTKREKEVAILLSNDANVADIGQNLGISIYTVQTNIRMMRLKFGKKTVGGLLSELFRKQLIN